MPASTRKTLLGRYHYDPLDRLVDCAPFDQEPIQRYYCKTRLATEIQGSVQRSIVRHDDQLLAQQQREGGKVAATLLATDQQHSVLNAPGATQPNALAYSPYGHRPRENGLLSLLGFNGERPDPVTGHYHLGNGYRQFNPVLMRFNSPDSWSPFGAGGLNSYAYCSGDPVNRKDPTGHYLVPAMTFDDIFMNTYKLMKDVDFRKVQFSNSVGETHKLFGGVDKLNMLADSQKTHADAIIARTLATPQEKITPLENFVTGEPPVEFLSKANQHLSTLLKNRNLNYELLNENNPYFKHLDETTIRNLRTDRLTNNRELDRTITYLLSLRIEGPSRAGGHFNANNWRDVALKIRTHK